MNILIILFLLMSSPCFASEFLIKAQDAINADPSKDARGSYKRGDVVVVFPDGHQWGKEECPPKFYIVKIPDMGIDEAQKYIAQDVDLTDPKHPVIKKRRQFSVQVDSLPANAKTALGTAQGLTTTKATVKNYVFNKETGTISAPTP